MKLKARIKNMFNLDLYIGDLEYKAMEMLDSYIHDTDEKTRQRITKIVLQNLTKHLEILANEIDKEMKD